MQSPSDPSKQSPEPTNPKRPAIPRIWIATAGAVVCVLAVGAWFGFPHLMQALETCDTTQLTSDLSAARSSASKREKPTEHRAIDEEDDDELPEYEGPSSAYIEAGADSKTLQFGFGQENAAADQQDDRKVPRLMSDDNVQFVVTRNQNDLMSCYGEELQYDETLAGKVDFEFAIAPDGHVAMVRVTRSTLRSKDAEDCFVEKARHWKFPKTNQDILTRFETDFTFAAN